MCYIKLVEIIPAIRSKIFLDHFEISNLLSRRLFLNRRNTVLNYLIAYLTKIFHIGKDLIFFFTYLI